MTKTYSIETLAAIADKITDLREGCYKHRLKTRMAKFNESRPGESFLKDHRDPSTVQGFLSPDDVQTLLIDNDRGQLLFQCGLTIIANDDVTFLSDDNTYADSVLGPSFMGVTFGRPELMIGKDKRHPTADDFVKTHLGNTVLCRTIDELACYLVTGDVPEHAPGKKLFVTKVGMTSSELLHVFAFSVQEVMKVNIRKIPSRHLDNYRAWLSSLTGMLSRYTDFVADTCPETIAHAAFAMGGAEHPDMELLECIGDGDVTKYGVFYESVWATIRNAQ